MTLDKEQRRVGAGMAAAVLATIAVLWLGQRFYPWTLPPMSGLAERLGFTLQADLFVLAWLVVAVGNVARGRFFSTSDIKGAGFAPPGPRIAIDVAIIQNTLEQAVLAVGAHLVLATQLPPPRMVLIPCLVALFCLGRLCFWLGYRGGAGTRAFGFATTFYPTVYAYVLAILLVLR
jgi:hypothetical protein